MVESNSAEDVLTAYMPLTMDSSEACKRRVRCLRRVRDVLGACQRRVEGVSGIGLVPVRAYKRCLGRVWRC